MDELLHALKGHYRANRRDLPWRHTTDPYRILVSEMMLQQTQVERVVPFYKKFVRRFPSARSLARSPFSEVLRHWQGLGYNRRAKYLHLAARQIAERGFPRWPEDIEALPGVGRYTARAVAAFAFNEPVVLIETNVRTVFIYHCFKNRKRVSDKAILPLVEHALAHSGMEPKDFYAAVMDYGAHLKKSGVKLNQKSAHYSKQTKFAGSARQLRGSIMRELLKHHATLAVLSHEVLRSREEVEHELGRLCNEGLVRLRGRYFSIPD
jgi:A/G-specific adenine glycosylase